MKHKVIFLYVLFILFTSFDLFSQVSDNFSVEQLKDKSLNYQPMMEFESEPLDRIINPDEYIVGPGDIFAINLNGEESGMYNLMITPEGKLIIPTVAALDLAGLCLTEVKNKITAAVKKKYLLSDLIIALTGVRKFRVTVAGQVENPGTVVVTAVDRVSDAIRIANIPLENQLMENESNTETEVEEVSTKTVKLQIEVKKQPAKRHIVLTRENGEILDVDLLTYETTGKNKKNPYLREGDQIYVPIYTKNVPSVEILGAVHQDGTYELMNGDRVMDIVELAHGFTYNADLEHIEIARFNADHKTTSSIRIDLSDSSKFTENNIKLQIDDRIYIRYIGGYNRKHTAELKGEIKYPGFYTIAEGKTRLSDVIRAGGGFTEAASLREAFIIRRPYENYVDPEFERLLLYPPGEMSSIEKEYFKMKSREHKGRIEVDFVRLFLEGDSTEDIYLKDGDYIEISRNSGVVEVSGKVKRPGLIAHKEGASVNYYIKEAGGYSWNARRNIRIIRAETGDWIKANGRTKVYVGDTIFVPEKAEINWGPIVRDFLQSAYVIASFIYMIERIQDMR